MLAVGSDDRCSFGVNDIDGIDDIRRQDCDRAWRQDRRIRDSVWEADGYRAAFRHAIRCVRIQDHELGADAEVEMVAVRSERRHQPAKLPDHLEGQCRVLLVARACNGRGAERERREYRGSQNRDDSDCEAATAQTPPRA